MVSKKLYRNTLNEFSKQKQAKISFLRIYLRHKGRNLKNSARSFQVGQHFHPGHPYPDILIIVSMYWNTHFDTTGPLLLGFQDKNVSAFGFSQ